MKEVFAGAVLAIAMTVAAAAPIAAHHSFAAEFDITRPVTLVGSVTKIEWTNPHAYLFIDVKDPQTGAVTNWEIEMGSPNGLTRLGWTRTMLKPATASPSKAAWGATSRISPTPAPS